MKKLLIAAALLCSMCATAFADKEVNVLYLDGTPHAIKMADIDKIELSPGNINVVKNSGANETYEISKIDKIEFRDGTTAVDKIKNTVGGDILVKTDGYGIDVSGLKDGDNVMVYTQGGTLVAKSNSQNGNAHVDGSSFSKGIYVIKAGGKSLKMVKK